jgi:hypothetical protein
MHVVRERDVDSVNFAALQTPIISFIRVCEWYGVLPAESLCLRGIVGYESLQFGIASCMHEGWKNGDLRNMTKAHDCIADLFLLVKSLPVCSVFHTFIFLEPSTSSETIDDLLGWSGASEAELESGSTLR